MKETHDSTSYTAYSVYAFSRKQLCRIASFMLVAD